MILALALLTQAAQPATPVRVWRADSTVTVSLRDPGYVTLLHVSAEGRISVLFPLEPDLDSWVPSDLPLQMSLPPNSQGTAATLVAIRSRWPFDFTALRAGVAPGSTWDYSGAWLLQPTAGDPLAAMLDIAERVTAGRPYDYGAVAYSNTGVVANRLRPRQPDVCLSCVRQGIQVAAAPAPAISNAVDCTNASLTNSFCGVSSGAVTITSAPAPRAQPIYQPAAAPAPAVIYVPYFVPITHGDQFFEGSPPALPASPSPPASPAAPAQSASQGVAYPIPPRLLVPSRADLRTLTSRRP